MNELKSMIKQSTKDLVDVLGFNVWRDEKRTEILKMFEDEYSFHIKQVNCSIEDYDDQYTTTFDFDYEFKGTNSYKTIRENSMNSAIQILIECILEDQLNLQGYSRANYKDYLFMKQLTDSFYPKPFLTPFFNKDSPFFK